MYLWDLTVLKWYEMKMIHVTTINLNEKVFSIMGEKKVSRRLFIALISAVFNSLLVQASIATEQLETTNFSGKWVHDKTSSEKEETGNYSFNGTIIMEITQEPAMITFIETYIRQGMKDFVMKPRTYYLDGRVTVNNSGTGPAREYSTWSKDKKVLTLMSIMTDKVDDIDQEFTTEFTYTLSSDGKTLTVEELHNSKLNGEKTIKNVYRKK